MIDGAVTFLTELCLLIAPISFLWVMVDKAMRAIIAAATGHGRGLDE